MYYTRRYKKRSKRKKTIYRLVKILGVGLIVLLVTATLRTISANEKYLPVEEPKVVLKADAKEPDVRSEIDGKYYGLCTKNSIRTVEDFRNTVQKDPVLAQHFSGFKWEDAKLGNLDEETWTLVSYRMGDIIQFTRRPVRLPKGDGYISDGTRRVRTLCCNDYEVVPPPVEVSNSEPNPPHERVDGPSRRFKKGTSPDAPPLQLSEGPPLEESGGAVPALRKDIPSFPEIPPQYVQRRYSSSHPHVVTPEPGTFLLMGSGLGVGILLMLRKNKR